MKVSIITVSFNSASTIEDTIKSVLSQNYKDIEYIIIDGDSTDGTNDILKKYEDNISTVISETDNGIYDAMNKGLAVSTGDVVGCLNADDYYADEYVVSRIAAAFDQNAPQAVYGDLVYVDRTNVDKIVRYWQADTYKQGNFYLGWVPPHPTFYCRRDLFEQYGLYRTDYRVAADFELMLRFMEKHHIKVSYIPDTLVHMRIGGKANTWAGILRGNREIIRAFKANGLNFPWKIFWYKPYLKLKQYLTKPKSQTTDTKA